MDHLKPLSRSSLALIAGCVAAITTACDSPVEITAFEPHLDRMACEPADVPSDFNWQAAGSFTLDDLARVTSDRESRREDLQAAGVRAGYFSNWRQVISRPPFDPPIDLTCQVIAFKEPGQAEAFLADLDPETTPVVASTITWLPRVDYAVTELPADDLPEGARLFRIGATDAGLTVTVHMALFARGSFVQAVLAGGTGADGAGVAGEVAVALAGRTELLVDEAAR